MPLDWLDYTQSKLFSPEMSEFKKYISMYYYAVLFLAINEIGPVNNHEILICVVTLLISQMINTLVFGQIAMLVSSI
jgi:hypothetical protein